MRKRNSRTCSQRLLERGVSGAPPAWNRHETYLHLRNNLFELALGREVLLLRLFVPEDG